MKRTTNTRQATGRNVAVITRRRPNRMTNDPPSIITIPWNPATIVLTATITPAASLTFSTLQLLLQQQILGGVALTVEMRLKRIRVWETGPSGNNTGSAQSEGFTMDVYDLFGLTNAASPNWQRPITTKTDLPARLNYAKLSYTYPKERASLGVNSSVGSKPIAEFKTLTTGVGAFTTLKIYFDVSWRYEPATTRFAPPLLLSTGNRVEVYNANRADNRDLNKTEEDQFSSLTESLGESNLTDDEDDCSEVHPPLF